MFDGLSIPLKFLFLYRVLASTRVTPVGVGGSCFHFGMDQWNSLAAKRLDQAASAMRRSGFTSHVREVIPELWRANCERYEPEYLHDDERTLGYTAAWNIQNHLADSVGAESVAHARPDEYGVPVFHVGSFNIRAVKIPVRSGRTFHMSDFRWAGRESRHAAAERNPLKVPRTEPGHEALFDIEVETAAELAALCDEVFLVWGGDLDSRLTAGWVGLPTLGPRPFSALQSLWWDSSLDGARDVVPPAGPRGDGLNGTEVDRPKLTLKEPMKRATSE